MPHAVALLDPRQEHLVHGRAECTWTILDSEMGLYEMNQAVSSSI